MKFEMIRELVRKFHYQQTQNFLVTAQLVISFHHMKLTIISYFIIKFFIIYYIKNEYSSKATFVCSICGMCVLFFDSDIKFYVISNR
jgi:hypothetical protein